MSLEQLAPKIARRDKNSFERLYAELSRTVFAVCLGIVHSRAVAEELMQDTFVSVWEHITDYGGKGFKTWIITIARNKALNALRKRKRELAVDFSENEALFGSYSIEESAERNSVLCMALRILKEDEREIVLMRNADMSVKEIAKVLGVPRSTVSWKYSNAIKQMQAAILEEL